MNERRCLEAVRDRKPMATNIFDLRRAEKAGLVKGEPNPPGYQWNLTPAGQQALAQSEQDEA